MKEEGSANSLGNKGKSDQLTKNTKIGAYSVIAILFVFIVWTNTTDNLPKIDVEKVASITSWSVGATATDSLGFFRREKLSDLEVEILSVGVVDKEGVFNQNDTILEGNTAGIRIRVKNIGKIDSSGWQFEINLPTKNNYVYSSPNQAPLEKNEEKTFIFTFDKLVATSSGMVTVKVSGEDKEESLENNSTIKNIEVF